MWTRVPEQFCGSGIMTKQRLPMNPTPPQIGFTDERRLSTFRSEFKIVDAVASGPVWTESSLPVHPVVAGDPVRKVAESRVSSFGKQKSLKE